MKIRSLSLVLGIAALASGAVAGEAVHVASRPVAAIPAHEALGIGDTTRIADVMRPDDRLAVVDMPACNKCH